MRGFRLLYAWPRWTVLISCPPRSNRANVILANWGDNFCIDVPGAAFDGYHFEVIAGSAKNSMTRIQARYRLLCQPRDRSWDRWKRLIAEASRPENIDLDDDDDDHSFSEDERRFFDVQMRCFGLLDRVDELESMVRQEQSPIALAAEEPCPVTDEDAHEVPAENPCAICMEQLTGRQMRTRCGHAFHSSCITKWTRRGKNTCPICRENINV